MPPISGYRGSIRMGSFEEHYHTPLKSENYIRIFILSPSFKKAPIQCSLRELSLSKPEIKYEALSYNWGSPKGIMPILCDRKRLFVTPNCFNALIHFWPRFRAMVFGLIPSVSTKAETISAPESATCEFRALSFGLIWQTSIKQKCSNGFSWKNVRQTICFGFWYYL